MLERGNISLHRMTKFQRSSEDCAFRDRLMMSDAWIEPHFHSIVDLYSGVVISYEVLSRGLPPYETPELMFRKAKMLGLSWELEQACRTAALRKIASLDESFKHAAFFINVSPDIFGDQRFIESFNEDLLRAHGLDKKNIVIEITEKKAFPDYLYFERLIAHYVNQGFRISLDDFGSGYSGLVTLIATTPHYLKLDMNIVRDIDRFAYKQKLVQAVVSFASNAGAKLIAEGVESWEELETLAKLGIRFAQGFLFGKPKSEPYDLPDDTLKQIQVITNRFNQPKVELNERLGSMVIRSQTIQRGTTNCEAMNEIFKKSPSVDHVVILEEEKPVAMIVRQHFYTETGGPFGYQLFRKKPVEQICKNKPLIVDERLSVTLLAKLAMDRFSEDLYDPVIVVRRDGTFAGTVTMKQVIEKSLELEVRWARNVNPLTQLPGNEMIRNWIHDALLWPEYTIIYADLDHFKEFNDNYGFLAGDEFLSLTAKVLSASLEELPEESKLGHVGGDDFVVVCPGLVDETPIRSICEAFDRAKLELFKSEHRQKGFMEVMDRQGMQIRIPLVTVSLAIIDSRKMWEDPHPALFSEIAASIKKKVKQITAETGRSAYLFERRSWVKELPVEKF